MARKLRLEYAGANYHVINRGNYRANVFAEQKTKAAFEKCLFEACEKSNWELQAYVIMINHYHLAVKTPDANLVIGMQWLQVTFAARFNRFRREHGHLFQGRYKALVVEDGDTVARICDYIHLNPVRAGVTTVPELRCYRYSSYWYLSQPKLRPKFMHPETSLVQSGGRSDNPEGWQGYEHDLAWQAKEGPAGKNRSCVNLSRGWALGSDAFRAELIEKFKLSASSRAWEEGGAREIKEARWGKCMNGAMRVLGKKTGDLSIGPKSARWKVAIAVFIKERTQASNLWLAHCLSMERPSYVSRLVTAAKREIPPSTELIKLRDKCTT